ncbi:hypothetical protein RN001_014635 [Aquatica leii]|uniref:BED-type domain-containing protein n=1 Tax=Aquatica leii TaxID=1421715 RepID=A0AAN7NZV4_9COLE|nr:hypothetical protein RN001_014635 [Aquatica leii]
MSKSDDNNEIDDDVEDSDELLPLILNGNFFKIKSDGNKISVQCITCSRIIKGQLNSTTNFRNHLYLKIKNHSIEEYNNYKDSNYVHSRKKTE